MLNNQAIFETLFDRNFSDRENMAFLKDFTATHPYFTPAQFYLLQLTESSAEQFYSQVDKTNILFNNPHWLNFQLQQTRREVMTAEEVEAVEKVYGVTGVHIADEVKELEVVDEVGEAQHVAGVNDVIEGYSVKVAEEVGLAGEIVEVDQVAGDSRVDDIQEIDEVEKVAGVNQVYDVKAVEEVGLVDEVDEVVNVSGGIGVDEIEKVEKIGGVNQVYDVKVNEEVGLADEVDTVNHVKAVEEVGIVHEVEKVAGIDDVNAVDEVPEPGYEQSRETYPEGSIVQSRDHLADEPGATEEDNGYQQEPELEPMKIELKMPEQQANLDEAMLFEPMHIVDYFASQGIKLTDVVQPGDKLGKQLKSFTEWLKTMKKVHVENEAAVMADTGTVIQTLAEISNMDTEVLTESMAEVFVKQGKLAKAGELYQKLSLLNPAKSAYFAAKIENLKEI